jgi:hypothetical protein
MLIVLLGGSWRVFLCIPDWSIFFFCGTGAWTQGLHLEWLHQPYFSEEFFETWSRGTICPDWLWTTILVSWVARITGTSHWHSGPGWSWTHSPPFSASWVGGIIDMYHCTWLIVLLISGNQCSVFIKKKNCEARIWSKYTIHIYMCVCIYIYIHIYVCIKMSWWGLWCDSSGRAPA